MPFHIKPRSQSNVKDRLIIDNHGNELHHLTKTELIISRIPRRQIEPLEKIGALKQNNWHLYLSLLLWLKGFRNCISCNWKSEPRGEKGRHLRLLQGTAVRSMSPFIQHCTGRKKKVGLAYGSAADKFRNTGRSTSLQKHLCFDLLFHLLIKLVECIIAKYNQLWLT